MQVNDMKPCKECYLTLGQTVLQIQSPWPLGCTALMEPFVTAPAHPHATVVLEPMVRMPRLPAEPRGEDAILRYYSDGSRHYAVTIPGTLGPLSVAIANSDYTEITLLVNEREHPCIVRTLDKVMQLIPIKQILIRRRSMILHSSQIQIGSKGIMFTAPSGTGKSTQANLWKNYENKQIICNDRTLIMYTGMLYNTTSFPVDGSSPISVNRQLLLGATVILRQNSVNIIQRPPAAKALKFLVEQTVADGWDREQMYAIQMEWLNIMETNPVYLLSCRPDHEAVLCLKERLIQDGVI